MFDERYTVQPRIRAIMDVIRRVPIAIRIAILIRNYDSQFRSPYYGPLPFSAYACTQRIRKTANSQDFKSIHFKLTFLIEHKILFYLSANMYRLQQVYPQFVAAYLVN